MDIDIGLIKRCKQNDLEAFNLLLSKYEGYLYKICFSYTRHKDEALDIMQEVYLKIYNSINSFDDSRPFLPWLKRLTINTCLNFQRDNRKHRQFSLDGYTNEEVRLHETIPATEDVEEIAIYRDTQQLVAQCIRSLPDKYRMAITLRYLENMSYEEIASATKQPLNTVKSNIFRARNLLKENLAKLGLMEV